MSSHSQVLRCCLVTLVVWCIVVARASAVPTRLPPDEQWSDEDESQHEVTNVDDDDLYEQTHGGDLDPSEEAKYDATAADDYEDELQADDHVDITEHDLRRLEDAQAQNDCGAFILSKLFDLEDDSCKGIKLDVYEDDKENAGEEEDEEYYEY